MVTISEGLKPTDPGFNELIEDTLENVRRLLAITDFFEALAITIHRGRADRRACHRAVLTASLIHAVLIHFDLGQGNVCPRLEPTASHAGKSGARRFVAFELNGG